jgi:hypothetical protein
VLGTSDVATSTSTPPAPFAAAVRLAKTRLNASLLDLQNAARQAGVRVDFYRILKGRVPPPNEVEPLLSVLRLPAEEIAHLHEVSRQHWAQRRNDRVGKAVARGQRAVCLKCPRTAPVTQVRHRKTFTAAKGGKPATFVHRECQGRPGQVTLICEIEGCTTPARSTYWSKRKKRDNQSRRVRGKRNTYSVPCANLHPGAPRPDLRKRQAGLRKSQDSNRERRFVKLLNAEYPEGLLHRDRRYGGHTLWVAMRTGVPEGLASRARMVRKKLFKRASEESALALYQRFRRALGSSSDHATHRAEDIWHDAKAGEADALRIVQETLSPEDFAFFQQWQAERQVKPGRPPRRGESATRGEAISRGQVRNRAQRVKGLTLCAGCRQLVHGATLPDESAEKLGIASADAAQHGRRAGRRYCGDCWDYLRKTEAFQQEREKRRQETLLLPAKQRGQRERRHIGPSRKRGRPTEKLDEHYHWLMKKAGGMPINEIAHEAGVTPEAVTLGIQGLESGLPADGWSKVFYERAGSRANEVREQLYPLQGRRIPAREMPARDERVRRLAALGMPMTLIAAKVGYLEDHVRAVLEKHGPADLSLGDRSLHVGPAPARAQAATRYRSPGRPPGITLDQAREIVAAKRGAVAGLARDFGITPAHAHRIRNGRYAFWRKLLASPLPQDAAIVSHTKS